LQFPISNLLVTVHKLLEGTHAFRRVD
jgi:hypothetical protein